MTKYHEYNPGTPTLALADPGQCQLNEEYTPLELLNKQQISENAYIFTFSTPDRTKPLNLSTCACILAKFTDQHGKDVVRPYTPCSTNAVVGSFECMIKIYPEGKMTQHLVNLKIGDKLEFKHIKFNVKLQYPFNKKFIGMIVGGTGITPMIQALHALLGNKKDQTEIAILYGSKTYDTILARSLLDKWSSDYARLTITHVLSQEPEDSKWDGERGRISKDLVEKTFPEPSGDMKVFVCGPPSMYDTFCGPRDKKDEITGILADLGYSPDNVYKF